MSIVNLYKVLNLEFDCKKKDIKKNYIQLVKIHHPDKGGDHEIFELITLAYNVLVKKNSRQKYDEAFKISNETSNSHENLKKESLNFLNISKLNTNNINIAKEQFDEFSKKTNNDTDDYKLTKKEITNRLNDLELAREQDDIENSHKKLFKNDNFNQTMFNAHFEGSRKTNTIIKRVKSPKKVNTENYDIYSTAINLTENDYNGKYSNANGDNESFVEFKKTNIKKINKIVKELNNNEIPDNYDKILKKRLEERNKETSELNNLNHDNFKKKDFLINNSDYKNDESEEINKLTIEYNNDDLKRKYNKLINNK